MPTELPEGLVLPVLKAPLDIVYPASSMAPGRPGPSGQVQVRVTVGVDGRPLEIEATPAEPRALADAARQAVSQARYTPATFQGRAVEVTLALVFEFRAPVVQPSVDEASDGVAALPSTPATEGVERTADEDEAPVQVAGTVLEGGLRGSLSGVTVIAVPAAPDLEPGRLRPRAAKRWRAGQLEQSPDWTEQTVTDDAGNFAFRGLPDGRIVLVFLVAGFERYEYVVDVEGGSVVEGKYYLTPANTNPYKTVVSSDRSQAAEVTRRSITPAEIASLPGTQGDALKAVQNFPGLARTPFGLGSLIVRGAAPGDSAVYVGGHEIPVLYHFAGVTSVFNADLIESISYVPSNFDARYGDATGGVVAVEPKALKPDGIHGYADADVFDASAVVRAPLGRGGVAAVGGRRSYLDLPLRAFDFISLAPRYWDYQGLIEHPVGRGTIGARAFGSNDAYVPVTDVAEDFGISSTFHRADLTYRQPVGKGRLYVVPSFTYFQDESLVGVTDLYTFALRGEGVARPHERFEVAFGTETRAGWVDLDLRSAEVQGQGPPPSSESSQRSASRVSFATPAVYSTITARLGAQQQVTVSPGIRVTGYLLPRNRWTVDPRLNGAWEITDTIKLKGGVGIYTQAPDLRELDEVFGNPKLESETSLQSSGGLRWDLPQNVTLEATGFYKHQWQLAVPSREIVEVDGELRPLRFASRGQGRSYGGELLVRRDFSAQLFGWLAYTLSRTVTRDSSMDPYRVADFDQTHILNLLLGYRLPRGFSLGARFRLSSGNPFTPVADGIYDNTTGDFLPLPAPQNADRLAPFHQLDVRVDKIWTRRLVRITAYLDVQNVYNARNPEFSIPSYDFRTQATIDSLPIIPSFGLKVEF
ncbi:MAG: TonB-dependent receptor [Myxococcales bacterium FL481]|nr:MAG: TonB-dependent receptor [Myxococcales bacterium FL481]